MRSGDGEQRDAALVTLRDHGVFMSEADESEIYERLVKFDDVDYDVAFLALRTCMCGARIDGFDEYWEHLRDVFSRLG